MSEYKDGKGDYYLAAGVRDLRDQIERISAELYEARAMLAAYRHWALGLAEVSERATAYFARTHP